MRQATSSFLLVLAVGISIGAPAQDAAPQTRAESTVAVEWDYGSGPRKTSVRYVGSRDVAVVYEPDTCREQFSLESMAHKWARPAQRDKSLAGHSFLQVAFRKHVAGSVDLPSLDVTQQKLDDKGKLTGDVESLPFSFPRFLARPVDDWDAADIDLLVAVPASQVHNPMDWTQIAVHCTGPTAP